MTRVDDAVGIYLGERLVIPEWVKLAFDGIGVAILGALWHLWTSRENRSTAKERVYYERIMPLLANLQSALRDFGAIPVTPGSHRLPGSAKPIELKLKTAWDAYVTGVKTWGPFCSDAVRAALDDVIVKRMQEEHDEFAVLHNGKAADARIIGARSLAIETVRNAIIARLKELTAPANRNETSAHISQIAQPPTNIVIAPNISPVISPSVRVNVQSTPDVNEERRSKLATLAIFEVEGFIESVADIHGVIERAHPRLDRVIELVEIFPRQTLAEAERALQAVAYFYACRRQETLLVQDASDAAREQLAILMASLRADEQPGPMRVPKPIVGTAHVSGGGSVQAQGAVSPP